MPPPARRQDRAQAAGSSANRSRMYNIAGHAHSSGSLLPRSTDVHAASTSAAANRGVDAAEAPYLTNLESHFGRVTLTAPDNLLRKQAKEKKAKVRQRKAQNAQAAAAALAGATSTAQPSSAARNGTPSAAHLLDPGRRYQTMLDDSAVSTGLLLPSQHMGMRRAHSGNQVTTLASTSNPQAPPPSAPQTTATRTRRRRPSLAREDSDGPTSRASGTSRPQSALSFNDHDPQSSASLSASARPPQNSEGEARRLRTESAPVTQTRRSQHAFATTPEESTASTRAPHTSLHRQNVWNDISEADPDDLPPPFPEGAPRPPDPPRPPTHSEAANDAQLIGPQPHAHIPDSPPPPFVSDSEDEPPTGTRAARDPIPPLQLAEQTPTDNAELAANDASISRSSSRSSSTSSASAESIELTEERRAWEADLQNGLSFEVRLLREQQRRVARERTAMMQARPQGQQSQGEEVRPAAAENAPSVPDIPATVETVQTSEPTPQVESVAVEAEAGEVGSVGGPTQDAPPSTSAETPASAAIATDEQQQDAAQPVEFITPVIAPAEVPLTAPGPVTEPLESSTAAIPTTASQIGTPPAEVGVPLPRSVGPATASTLAIADGDMAGRLRLANEPRLGLPSMIGNATANSGRPNSVTQPTSTAHRQVSAHHKTSSDPRPALSQPNVNRSRPGSASRPSGNSFIGRQRDLGQTGRAHGSESHLPLSRRPEDTLYVISAPPPAVFARSSSEDEASSQQAATSSRVAPKEVDAASESSSHAAVLADDDDGAESDSSIEQWLAESAAFDALRKREEEAAARLQALREPVVSDSDKDEDDAAMPGAFTRSPVSFYRASTLGRQVPDPANLARMDDVLPKAPPPLVLGRSRGGAAYSDSSDSTDTDDALDQYSSSDEDDEQHRAFYEASAGDEVQRTINDPFVGAHKAVHTRNTSSAPNLTIPDEEEGPQNVIDLDTTANSRMPARHMSSKAQGKLPERKSAPQPLRGKEQTKQSDTRAGDFEEDTSSSRDISDDEEAVQPTRVLPTPLIPVTLGADATYQNSIASLTRPSSGPAPAQGGVRRPSLDPLLQPLVSGRPSMRPEVGNRLKGLFGQPLVAGSEGHPVSALHARSPVDSIVQALPSPAEMRQSISNDRHASVRSEQEPDIKVSASEGRASETATVQATVQPDASQDDEASIAPSRVSTLRRHSSTTSGRASRQSSSTDAANASSSAVPPEQKARDEALAQIAKLSATTVQRQDSLAALERLLAKTGRPTSMLLPSAMSRAELDRRLQLTPGVAPADSQSTTEGEGAPSAPVTNSANRLSRSGAIVRNRLPVPPTTGVSRNPSTSRPVSFVNPRSSAAPLPRGRLPAITDATRHFPPSASSTGPGVVPSWLSYIPSEERERLPAPLEPQRINTALRTPGSRVSAMITRFEAPQEERSPSSPTKPVTPFAGATSHVAANNGPTDPNRNVTSDGTERADEPAVFRRFSRKEGANGESEASPVQRRPPPLPPMPRRPDTNPFRRSQSGQPADISRRAMPQSSSVEALARQIEEAVSSWSLDSSQGATQQDDARRESTSRSTSRLGVPTLSIPAAGSSSNHAPMLRSSRTQAIDTLTRREHDPNSATRPMPPSKSPLMTPEQIVAGGSRTGLSASIAAAQAAAFARREGRHSASSSIDTAPSHLGSPARHDWGQHSHAGSHSSPRSSSGPVDASASSSGATRSTSRPLSTLPPSVRSVHGLGIDEENGTDASAPLLSRSRLPAPPPLPTRPYGRNWDQVESVGLSNQPQPRVTSPRALPNIPTPPQAVSRSSSAANLDTPGRDGASPSRALPLSSSGRTSSLPHMERRTSSTSVGEASRPAEAGPASTSTSAATPGREASLGITDFDLLVAQLERDGSHYEQLSAIGEFLGPAKRTAATAEQLASLSVGLIECDSRRVTREGKVKQKLSCVGVRVDKCPICFTQFREAQRTVILPCGHILHESCATQLFKQVSTCPTCRAGAF